MPNANNNLTYYQWQSCDVCGFLYPMGSLVKQKGRLVCKDGPGFGNGCWDDLTVERRQWLIEMVLGPQTEMEGADMRVIDRGFFEDFDEINY